MYFTHTRRFGLLDDDSTRVLVSPLSVLTLGPRKVTRHLPGFKEMEVPTDIAYLHKYASLHCHDDKDNENNDKENKDNGDGMRRRVIRSTRSSESKPFISDSSSSLSSRETKPKKGTGPTLSKNSFMDVLSDWQSDHCRLSQSKGEVVLDQSEELLTDQSESGMMDHSDIGPIEDLSLLALQSIVHKSLPSITANCGKSKDFVGY